MSREVCGICWCPYDEDTGECACAPVQPRGAMNKDEIIRMAREAGMERVVKLHSDGTRTVELPHPDLLERFAALVAAAEQDRCCKIVYGMAGSDNVAQRTVDAIRGKE